MLNFYENDGKHIQKIIFDGTCKQHQADRGEPCYTNISGTEELLVGVCGKRIKAAGYNGKISDAALRKAKAVFNGGNKRK